MFGKSEDDAQAVEAQEEVKTYRVLTKNAVIGDQHFTEADDCGGFGTVEMTETEAQQHMDRGVSLSPVDGEGDENDDEGDDAANDGAA